jgi:predicted aspartyl protease
MKQALLFVSLAVAAAGIGPAMSADRKCELVQIAEWPVRADSYRPVVDASINGQKVGVLLDTGLGLSYIRRSAANKLRLTTSPKRGYRLFGIGGESQVEETLVEEFRMGDAVYKNWVALVAGEHPFPGDLAVLLGYDFLNQMDIEFDLANGVVRLFQARGCERASLAYWSKQAVQLPLETGKYIFFSVSINGKPLLAELDSGATFSSLALEGAVQLDVTPQTPGVTFGGCVTGMGKVRADQWIAGFESFRIGDEVIRSPKIRFGDLWQHTKYESTGSSIARRLNDLPDMVLGADFLRAHRVYVAHSQGKLYFSYSGGTVFPTTAGKPCSELKD